MAGGLAAGAGPRCKPRQRHSRGNDGRRNGDVRQAAGVSTATLTTVLLKRVAPRVDARHAAAGAGLAALVGRAFTMRFVPGREDLATPAIVGLAEIDARRHRGDAGRLHRRDRCDGHQGCRRIRRYPLRPHAPARRDRAGHRRRGARRGQRAATGLPVWCDGAAAPPSVASLHFVGWQEPIGCGGVCVFPDDVIVADSDGAVLIPAAMRGRGVQPAVEQERLEDWIMAEIGKGVAAARPVPGQRRNQGALRARARRKLTRPRVGSGLRQSGFGSRHRPTGSAVGSGRGGARRERRAAGWLDSGRLAGLAPAAADDLSHVQRGAWHPPHAIALATMGVAQCSTSCKPMTVRRSHKWTPMTKRRWRPSSPRRCRYSATATAG